MSYQPYLIAQYSTGLDNEVEPWLLPGEAQDTLFDGFVYRGVWEKRQGYTYYATGEKAGRPFTESRIVHNVPAVATGQTNLGLPLLPINLASTPVRRGTVTVTDGIESHTDNGLGFFNTALSGTINYITGVISNFQFNAASGAAVTVTYDFFPGLPVMMVASFYTETNTRQLIVADTRYVNRYNSATDLLEDISPAGASVFSGDNTNFFSWLNYPDANDVNRLLFVNYVDPIKSYDGTSPFTNYTYNMLSTASVPVPITTLSCLLMFQLKDRLILLRTRENGTIYPRRIRISGTGVNSDDFRTSATGAGVIEIPDDTWIMGASFNRDDLLIVTEMSVWAMKYTGDDSRPFILVKLDSTRGSNAPFGCISYLGRTTAASRRGLIACDGYKVERIDDKIPDYSYNKIDQDTDNFALCFAGTVDEDRDLYLIHPSPGQSKSDRILVTNYEEDNFCVYRLPLSCMGNYLESFDITWVSLLKYQNWDQFASDYDSWNEFGYTKGTPISIGGGHFGEIWQLNLDENEDNPVPIYNITIIDVETIEVTTAWNNYSDNDSDVTQEADYIFIDGVVGFTNLNNRQFPILSTTDHYTFRLTTLPSEPIVGAFESGGLARRVIPFESKTKKFNPFANIDKKVRCGWLYFYVTTSTTFLKQLNTADPTEELDVACDIIVEVITNDTEKPTQVSSISVSPYLPTATIASNEQEGIKKWSKVWINQTARFIQFKVKNTQAGSKIKIQAMMPGFQPVGRLI